MPYVCMCVHRRGAAYCAGHLYVRVIGVLLVGQEIAEIIPGDGLPRLSAKWNEYKIKLCLLSGVIGHL